MEENTSPELTEMEKAVHCVNAVEPLAVPINTRHVLASIAISARRSADYQHLQCKQNEELREHLSALHMSSIQVSSQRAVIWVMIAIWGTIQVIALVLKLMRYL